DRLIAPLVGEGLRLVRAASADRLEHGPIFQIKEIVDFAIGVGMRPAHEAVTDHADVQGFRHGWILRRRIKTRRSPERHKGHKERITRSVTTADSNSHGFPLLCALCALVVNLSFQAAYFLRI